MPNKTSTSEIYYKESRLQAIINKRKNGRISLAGTSRHPIHEGSY